MVGRLNKPNYSKIQFVVVDKYILKANIAKSWTVFSVSVCLTQAYEHKGNNKLDVALVLFMQTKVLFKRVRKMKTDVENEVLDYIAQYYSTAAMCSLIWVNSTKRKLVIVSLSSTAILTLKTNWMPCPLNGPTALFLSKRDIKKKK